MSARPEEMEDRTLIMVCDVELFPPYHGNRTRILHFIKCLRQYGYEIILVSPKSIFSSDISITRLKEAVDKYIVVDDVLFSTRFKALIKELNPLAIIAQYAHMCSLFDHETKDTLKIVDTHDVMHIMSSKYMSIGLEPYYSYSMEDEIALLKKADVIIAIQENEANILKNMLPDHRIICIGHCDIRQRQEHKSIAKNDIVMLVGSDNRANKYSLDKFIHEAWPIIIKYNHNAKLYVYGLLANTITFEMQGIVKIGYVKDLRKAYQRAKVVINP